MAELTESQRAAILAAAEELEGAGDSLRARQDAHLGTYGEHAKQTSEDVASDLLDLAERVDALASAIATALRGESLRPTRPPPPPRKPLSSAR
jgi:hypothetical protein